MLHRYYSGVVARRHYVTYATMLNVHNYARALLRNRGVLLGYINQQVSHRQLEGEFSFFPDL